MAQPPLERRVRGEAMGKITGSRSTYSHNWRKIGFDHYRLSWTFDVKLQGSRLRWPRTMTRDTDEAGAIRFAKKWDLEAPNAPVKGRD